MYTISVKSINLDKDLEFLEECYKNNYKLVGYDSNNPYRTKAFLNKNNSPEDTFIVYKDNKKIGFFKQTLDKAKQHIGGEVFVHPDAGFIALYRCIRACMHRGIIYAYNNDYKYIVFHTWHQHITSYVQRLIPEIAEYVLYDQYRILFCKFLPDLHDRYKSMIKITNPQKLEIEFEI